MAAIPDCVWSGEVDGHGQWRYNYYSPAVERITGRPPSFYLHDPACRLETVHANDRSQLVAAFQRLATGESEHDEVEYRLVLPDGNVRWVRDSARATRLAPNRYRVDGVLSDITDRKRAEEALRDSESTFRTFVDQATDAFFLHDHDDQWRILDVNRRACESLGYTREELIGMTPSDFDPEVDDALLRWIDERLGAGVVAFESHHRRKDGVTFPVEVRIRPFSHGGRLLAVTLVQDITKRKRIEEALRQSQAYLAETQRMTHTGSWAFDLASNQYVYASEECFRVFELDPDKGPPDRAAISRLIHPEDRERVNASFERSVREKEDTVSEFRIVLPSGTAKHVQAIRHPVLSASGDVVQVVGTFIDITERKHAEEALRENEAYLAEGQRLSHTGSWAWNPTTGQTLYWSEEMFRIFELDPRQGVPATEILWDRVHPEDRERTHEVLSTARHQESAYEHDHRILLPDGSVKHIHAVGHPVFDEAGDVIKFVGTAMDVTERKHTEDALRRTAAYLNETQRLTHTGTFVSDQTTRPLYWSEELFRIFGFDPRDGLPTREQPLERLHPEDLDKFKRAWDRVINLKVDSDVEYRIVLPDATVKHVYGLGHPVSNANGELVEIVGTTIDITERKRADEERERLRRLEADLRHLNRVSMMGELAASVAHEVNQPISGVVSNASACLRWLAREVPDLEEAREAARRIVRDGKRAGEIVTRIRALATKSLATHKAELDLNATMQEVLALIGDEAKRKTVSIRTEFAADISHVAGDRVQLQQVALNLVMNAIDAMSSVGDRARELVVATRNIDADQVLVTVEDSGVGIESQKVDKIFDSFYTTKPDGMGMGLAISRSILQEHGGLLWATAKDRSGTIFHFTLPKYHGEESNAAVAGV